MILGTLLLTALLSPAAGHGKRSLTQLEYVVKVLEQQGRLGEVDGDLLARINSALDKERPAEQETPEVEERTVRRPEVARSFSSAKERFLERARLRQQRLFGKKNRVEDKVEEKVEEETREDQCREEREQMRRLERRVLELEEELEITGEQCGSQQFSAQNSARHIPGLPSQVETGLAPSPLDQLLAAAAREETVELQGSLEEGVVISSHLVTPTPTVSTILSSLTEVTVLTVTHTQELVVNFHGRKINTQLLEEEEVTSTVTTVVSSTVEITPAPSWQFVTITPTPTQAESVVIPPQETVNSLLLRQRIEQEKQALMERIQVLGPPLVPAQVVEIPKNVHNIEALQQYVEDLRRLRSEKTASIRAEPQVAEQPPPPSTSVSTIYMSGSRPGEFSTVLSTVTLDRVRREGSQQAITVTRPPDL